MMNPKNTTKQKIYEEMSIKTDLEKEYCKKIFEDILEGIELLINTDGEVKITHFGTFRKKNTPQRMVNIPPNKKGEKILGKKPLESRVKCQLKPSIALKNMINKNYGEAE